MLRPFPPAPLALLLGFTPALAAQQAPPIPAPVPNAAALYRAVVADLGRTFGIGEEPLSLPTDGIDDPASRRFAEAEWTELVGKAAKELDTFAQASRLPACDFGPAEDPTRTGYEAVQIPLWQLATLTAARGWQRLHGSQPAEAAVDACTLLRHARHVGAQTSGLAAYLAVRSERLGFALLGRLCDDDVGLGGKDLDRCRSQLDEHARLRAGRLELVRNIQAEVHRLLTPLADAARRGKPAGEDTESQLLAERGADVVARVEAIVAAWLHPLLREGELDLPAALAELEAKVQAVKLEARPKDVRARLGADDPEQAVDALAKVFALMLVPDVAQILTDEARARAELQDCRDRLAKRLPARDAAK